MQDTDLDLRDTGSFVIVNSRWPLFAGGALGMTLLCAMAFQLGSHRSLLPQAASLLNSTEAGSTFVSATSPIYGFTTVEVTQSGDGDLEVDGKSVGSSHSHDLQLAAGPHKLVLHTSDKILSEEFSTAANESLRFEFQTSRVRVFRELVNGP